MRLFYATCDYTITRLHEYVTTLLYLYQKNTSTFTRLHVHIFMHLSKLI